MNFSVAPECERLGLRAGAIVFRGVRVARASGPLCSAIARECAAVQARFAGPAAIRSAPEVAAFQESLRQVGVNPRREQCSVDRLLTYAYKRGSLPEINSLVDAYNLVSIRSCCSLGAHDIDRITSPVSLRILTDAKTFTPLGSTEPATVQAGEYAYVDGQDSVLCRLDVVQADFSKVTTATVNALLIIEATSTHVPAVARQAFADAVELIQQECGGTAETIALPF